MSAAGAPPYVVGAAAAADVQLIRPLTGGQFGAWRASDSSGRPLVLKAWPLPDRADEWALGASMAGRMRDVGYPAPQYLGTGATDTACWSVQELLAGVVAGPTPNPAVVRQLLELAAEHQDRAGVEGDLAGHIRSAMQVAIRTLASSPFASPLARELNEVLVGTTATVLRLGDVVHYDFHPGNCLVQGDSVVGVFDWEGARPGDWRCDLANLVVTCDSPAAASALREAPPDVAALLIAWHCARYLAFDVTHHTSEELQRALVGVEQRLARWWRTT